MASPRSDQCVSPRVGGPTATEEEPKEKKYRALEKEIAGKREKEKKIAMESVPIRGTGSGYPVRRFVVPGTGNSIATPCITTFTQILALHPTE